MPLLTRLTATFRSWAGVPTVTPDSSRPKSETELDLLRRLVSDPALTPVLSAFRLQAADLQARLASQYAESNGDPAKTQSRVRKGMMIAEMGCIGEGVPTRSTAENSLGFLVTMGSNEIRRTISQLGVEPAALVFWLAHGEHEAALRARWPTPDANNSQVTVMNDPYSPMEAVHRFLIEAFDLPEDKAIEFMLLIHHKGAMTRELPAGTHAVPFCDACNARWRASGIPLYVQPGIAVAADV